MGKLIYRSRKRGKKRRNRQPESSGASEADVEVWTMDEHRLAPVLQDVGSEGEQPIAQVAFSVAMAVWFVHPQSGETYWWILPKVNINLFNRVLADFAKHFGPGRTSKSFWRWIKPVGIQVRK